MHSNGGRERRLGRLAPCRTLCGLSPRFGATTHPSELLFRRHPPWYGAPALPPGAFLPRGRLAALDPKLANDLFHLARPFANVRRCGRPGKVVAIASNTIWRALNVVIWGFR